MYNALDEKEYRYVYARKDLYMWKDLLCDRIGGVAKPIIVGFINENPQSNLTLSGVVFEFSFKLIVEHMGRFIYHTWRMRVSGFMGMTLLFLMFSEKFIDVKWIENTKRFLYGKQGIRKNC